MVEERKKDGPIRDWMLDVVSDAEAWWNSGAADSTPHFFSTQLKVSAVVRKLTRRIDFLLDFSFVVSSYTFMSNHSL
jgi:hypothetical protein